jgi:hypothetical protein
MLEHTQPRLEARGRTIAHPPRLVQRDAGRLDVPTGVSHF